MKRYARNRQGWPRMDEEKDGEYVLFADHKSALKALAKEVHKRGLCHRTDCAFIQSNLPCTCDLIEVQRRFADLIDAQP